MRRPTPRRSATRCGHSRRRSGWRSAGSMPRRPGSSPGRSPVGRAARRARGDRGRDQAAPGDRRAAQEPAPRQGLGRWGRRAHRPVDRPAGRSGRWWRVRGSWGRSFVSIGRQSRGGRCDAEVTSGPSSRAGRQNGAGRAARLSVVPDLEPSQQQNPLRATGLSPAALLDLVEALDVATRGISGVLSFERVLQLIVDRVRELVGAQYAALGIADDRGVLERFVTSGLTRDAARADRPAAARPRAARAAHPRGRPGPDPGHRRRPQELRVPAPPPADGLVPGRPDHGSQPGRRRPVPDEQAGRGRVQRRRPGGRRDVRPPCRDRDRERPAPRGGPAAGGGRGAGADRPGPPRRDHPEPVRVEPVARGRARVHGLRSGRGAGPGRPGDRRPPPGDPRHPQLHLRAPPGAARPGRPGRGPRGGRRRVPPQHHGRPRLQAPTTRSTRSSRPRSPCSSSRSPRRP